MARQWLAAALLVASCHAQLDSYISDENVVAYQKLATDAIKSGSPEELYFGTKLLSQLGGDVSGACKWATNLVKGSPSDISAIGYGGAVLNTAKCSKDLGTVSDTVAATIKESVEAATFTPKVLAVLGASSLGLGLDAADVEKNVKRLSKFKDEEGLFRESMDDRRGSTDRTFLMLELIAATGVKSKGVKLTLEKASQLLPGVLTEGEASVDAATLTSALALATGEPLQLSAAALQATASRLLKLKALPSVATAYKVYSGIRILGGFADAPLAVLLPKPVVRSSKEPLQLLVRDLLGRAVEKASVTISRLTLPAKKRELETYRDRALTSTGNGAYEASLNLEPGLYTLSLILSVEGRVSTTVERSLVVKTSASITDVQVVISPSRQVSEGQSYSVSSGSRLPAGLKASASEGEFVIVKFTVPVPSAPHQAFVRFTHTATNVDSYFPAQRSDIGSGWALTATISLTENVATLMHKSGDYHISLLVGDVVLERPVQVDLGTVTLQLPPKVKPQYPLYTRPLLWDSDNAQAPLPEIHHQFRQPERRPNPIVPTFFTLLILAELLVFFALLPVVGGNLKGVPGGMGFIWTAGFFACLLIFLLFFTAYFIQMKMMTLLRYLLFLSVAAVFVGHKAFSASAQVRASKET